VDAVAKELEIYAGEEPPLNYALDIEVEGILQAAEASGFERFHLVGYSGGGASSLAFAAKHTERLRSLALLEPAWAGNEGLDPAEEAVWREFDRIMALSPEEMMPAFVRSNLGPGVEPPPGPPPPASRLPSTSRWEAAATRTTTRRSPNALPAYVRTSRSRCSRSAITSTRRSGSSPSGSLHRFGAYGPTARPSPSPGSS
jgi:pimeloyl-ACP methyl ester carboxylesterase